MSTSPVTEAVDAMRDSEPLRAWLHANVEGFDVTEPLDVELLAGGKSNLTVALGQGELDVVLRRPPVGAFLPSANDMTREHTFLSALAPTSIPTPKPFGLCEDPDVIGVPFYVMERLHGIVVHEAAALEGITAEQGRRLSERLVDVLVDLHSIDPDDVGLGGVARRTGYLERQVRRWLDQYERSKDGYDDPVIAELAAVLQHAIPTSLPSTIVHGDYRLGNLMVDADDLTRIIGVFDWEMATLGDPLADVGYTILFWGERGGPAMLPGQDCAALPGFFTGDDIAQRYADRSGRAIDDLTFYVVLAAFKLSVIGLGHLAVQRRAGGADGDVGPVGSPLAQWALDLWHERR